MLEPGDILVDCTGARSLMRDLLIPGDDRPTRGRNTKRFRLEYALVVTFLYGQQYACNEYCKYYKNLDNASYKFIPAVHRTYYDGAISHVTGIVGISQAEYESMPPNFDGAFLRDNFPTVAQSMDRFIDKVRAESHGELVGDLDIMRIPFDLYHARNATSRRWRGSGIDHPLAQRRSSCSATRQSDRPISSRSHSAWSARSSCPATSRTEPVGRRDVRRVRGVHVPAVAAGLHADADDQAQQGPARIGRRPLALLAKLHVF